MSKKMLIDATHQEETRVVILDGNRIEDLDVETSIKKQIKSNIYLAKIIRVEPSLQAAFVDYGGNRHGFLAFNEIHPDYYQIPVADKEKIKEEMLSCAKEDEESEEKQEDVACDSKQNKESEEIELPETVTDVDFDELVRIKHNYTKNYKIQEVIRKGQVLLVQVVKEERGNKGAALTTYLSLAGRYCVLMPNNVKGGGISKKISNSKDRQRLKKILNDLEIPQGMSVIVRTAGKERTKVEIKRDYDFLIKSWIKVRDLTVKSTAPSLVLEEGNIIRRSLRDNYNKEIEEIVVAGEEGFKNAKEYLKMLSPTQAKKIALHKEKSPIFYHYQIENQLESIHSPYVQLKSGAYLVINQTEALVAIDVNSGRATKERSIEETALKANLEAAEEIARQLRLRDMAGLVVIDFIDMEEMKNNHAVERKMKEALKKDRARIQVGKISGFGLMEISRQRRHSSLLESNYHVCPHCRGRGLVRSSESAGVYILRMIEEEGIKGKTEEMNVFVPTDLALHILNKKRQDIIDLEIKYEIKVVILADAALDSFLDYRIEKIKMKQKQPEANEGKKKDKNEPLKNNNNNNGSNNNKVDDLKNQEKENNQQKIRNKNTVVEEKTENEENNKEVSGQAQSPLAENGSKKKKRNRNRFKNKNRDKKINPANNNEAGQKVDSALETIAPTQDVITPEVAPANKIVKEEEKTAIKNKEKKPEKKKVRNENHDRPRNNKIKKDSVAEKTPSLDGNSSSQPAISQEAIAKHEPVTVAASSLENNQQEAPEAEKTKKKGWWNKTKERLLG